MTVSLLIIVALAAFEASALDHRGRAGVWVGMLLGFALCALIARAV